MIKIHDDFNTSEAEWETFYSIPSIVKLGKRVMSLKEFHPEEEDPITHRFIPPIVGYELFHHGIHVGEGFFIVKKNDDGSVYLIELDFWYKKTETDSLEKIINERRLKNGKNKK